MVVRLLANWFDFLFPGIMFFNIMWYTEYILIYLQKNESNKTRFGLWAKIYQGVNTKFEELFMEYCNQNILY